MRIISLFCLAVLSSPGFAADLPIINARFETTVCAVPCGKPARREWQMLRTPQQLELHDKDASFSEIWIAAKDRFPEYEYVMHDEKLVIDYNRRDLEILKIQPSWEQLTQLISNQELGQLRLDGRQLWKGLPAETYTGQLQDAQVTLTWIPHLKIVAEVQYVYADRKAVVQALEINSGPANKGALTQLDQYRTIDYTDIGDAEHTASAQAWIRKARYAPGLNHHHAE